MVNKVKKFYDSVGVPVFDTSFDMSDYTKYGIIVQIGRQDDNDPTMWRFTTVEKAWNFVKILLKYPKIKFALQNLNTEIHNAKQNPDIAVLLRESRDPRLKDMLGLIGVKPKAYGGVYYLFDAYGGFYEEIIHEKFMFWLVGKDFKSLCHTCNHCQLDRYKQTGWMNCECGQSHEVVDKNLAHFDEIENSKNFNLELHNQKVYTDLCINAIKRCKMYSPTVSNKAKLVKLIFG